MNHPIKIFSLVLQDVCSGGYEVGQNLEVEAFSCLRDLSGRRAVWKVAWEGQDMVLKIFNPHAKQGRDVGREWDISRRLHRDGLPIAEPLFKAEMEDGFLAVAFRYIPEGVNLNEVLAVADEGVQRDCYDQLLAMHAQQHACGYFQSDNHLGNYLWSCGKLYMLDAGSCVVRSAPLGMPERVANMAMLTANVLLRQRWVYDAAYRVYLDQVGEGEGEFLAMSRRAVPAAIERRLKKYLRKTRRASGSFEREDSPGKKWHACREIDPVMKQKFLGEPELFFNEGNACGDDVAEVCEGGKVYLLKRYPAPSWMAWVVGKRGIPRALRDWSHGHALRLFGMTTPAPVACLRLGSGLFPGRSYLLVEKVDGVPPSECDAGDLPALARQFLLMWRGLNTLGVSLGRMQMRDFLVDGEGRLVLAEVEHVEFTCLPREREDACQADCLGRFLESDDGVAASVREAVLAEFDGC